MPPIHCIAFDVPYPPDYGGAIDVYAKLAALAGLGAKATLHCFQYGRKEAPPLNQLCEGVYYYPRITGISGLLPFQPYMVSSRRSGRLLERLCQSNAPILFEGLHCCHYLPHKKLRNRLKLVRMHNIEWQYYQQLRQHQTGLGKRLYLALEAKLLKRYERVLGHADLILGISPQDCAYLQQRWPGKVAYLPAFHANKSISAPLGSGEYALYQGNLGVAENLRSAAFLCRVFERLPSFELVVAGKNPPPALRRMVSSMPNVRLVPNPDGEEMDGLIRNAHVNVLPSFQNTGVKLKLVNALYRGRHCLTNPVMASGLPLEEVCHFAEGEAGFRTQIGRIFSLNFGQAELDGRKAWLGRHFDNAANASKLLDLIAANR